jgi:hypothetical protein
MESLDSWGSPYMLQVSEKEPQYLGAQSCGLFILHINLANGICRK